MDRTSAYRKQKGCVTGENHRYGGMSSSTGVREVLPATSSNKNPSHAQQSSKIKIVPPNAKRGASKSIKMGSKKNNVFEGKQETPKPIQIPSIWLNKSYKSTNSSLLNGTNKSSKSTKRASCSKAFNMEAGRKHRHSSALDFSRHFCHNTLKTKMFDANAARREGNISTGLDSADMHSLSLGCSKPFESPETVCRSEVKKCALRSAINPALFPLAGRKVSLPCSSNCDLLFHDTECTFDRWDTPWFSAENKDGYPVNSSTILNTDMAQAYAKNMEQRCLCIVQVNGDEDNPEDGDIPTSLIKIKPVVRLPTDKETHYEKIKRFLGDIGSIVEAVDDKI